MVAPCFTEKSQEGNESCNSNPYAALILFSIVSAGQQVANADEAGGQVVVVIGHVLRERIAGRGALVLRQQVEAQRDAVGRLRAVLDLAVSVDVAVIEGLLDLIKQVLVLAALAESPTAAYDFATKSVEWAKNAVPMSSLDVSLF